MYRTDILRSVKVFTFILHHLTVYFEDWGERTETDDATVPKGNQ